MAATCHGVIARRGIDTSAALLGPMKTIASSPTITDSTADQATFPSNPWLENPMPTGPAQKYVDDVYLPAQADARDAGLGQWGAPPTPVPTPVPTAPPAPSSSCHASYVGYCVTAGIGDWDCAGGSGNGPNYLPVAVQVVGHDEFDLDRDGDGWGCE